MGKFGKSEAYIRSRLKLGELIDALAEMLDKEDISVGVATEIAKDPADIQQEVYDDHFAEGCYSSWKTARIKEIARRLYERYMTKLESYNFDKTECLSCHCREIRTRRSRCHHYRNQLLVLWLRNNGYAPALAESSLGIQPVSYTHLDVYKRQGYKSVKEKYILQSVR